MKIDWSKAPEDATHYCPETRLFYSDSYPMGPCCIPRPTKPEPQEWSGEGLPPVGVRIEVQNPEDGTWSDAGEVTDIKTFVYTTSMRAGFNSTCHFRQTRTQAEREREELVNHCCMTIGSAATHEQVAEHMYNLMAANYNLTPKGDR